MKKTIFRGKSIFIRTLILSFCLTFISAGTVFASSENAKVLATQSTSSDSALLEKLQEIDKSVIYAVAVLAAIGAASLIMCRRKVKKCEYC